MNGFDEKELRPDFPRRVMLEVSGLCNHRCIFCSNKKSRRDKRVIRDETARKVIQEARDCGAAEISFHGMGEPLICDRLRDYVALSKDLGYEYVYIDTNGALAVPDVINPIVDAGIDSIKFSISAANREDFERVQGRDDFDKVLDNLKRLSDYRKKANPAMKILVGFVETKYTEGQFHELKKLLQDRDIDVNEVWFSGTATQGGTMTEENKEIESGNPAERLLCREPFDRIVVNCEGLICACCMWDDSNDLFYGDANRQSLKDAWYSEAAVVIRRQHLTGIELNNSCKRCEAYKLYQKERQEAEKKVEDL